MSKAGGTISQQAAVHPWLAADAHGNKQTNKPNNKVHILRLVIMQFDNNLTIPYIHAINISVLKCSLPID
jgi:hypothetical protein